MHDLKRRALKMVPILPRPVRRTLSVAIGTIAWAIARQPRRGVVANLNQVLKLQAQPTFMLRLRRQRVARRIFCNCISNYFELFALPGLSKREILDRIDVRGVEHFENAVALGRGVIVASAHLGPFEYLTSWMPTRGFEMTIPVQKVRDQGMLLMMLEARLANNVKFVPLNGIAAIRAMFRTLKRKQVVLITADRAIEGANEILDFFGAPARLPMGPVDLSILTGAPMVGGFGWRNGRRDVIEFMPISLALSDGQRSDRQALQAALVRQLEQIIGDHLDEWVVFEPVWQT